MITGLGLERPTYDDILQSQIQRCKKLFGEDIDTSELSVLGKYIRIAAYDISQAYEDLEATYYARYPNTASGINLDRLCPYAGITRNPAIAATRKVEISGTANAVVKMGFLFSADETETEITYYTVEDVTLDSNGKGTVNVTCTELGTIGNVELGTITKITNPSVDVDRVKDVEVIAVGKAAESDYKLRKRWLQAIGGGGSGTAASIRSEIYRIQNVESVTVIENDSDYTDAQGRPPHSFEAYVFAPLVGDTEIAKAIFRKKPIGIKSYGNTAALFLDDYDIEQTVNFTRSTEIEIRVNVEIRVNNDFEGIVGKEKIAERISDYVMNLGNGEDVYRTKFYSFVHSVAGVVEVPSITISADGGKTYTENNFMCDPWELPRLIPDNVNVRVIP